MAHDYEKITQAAVSLLGIDLPMPYAIGNSAQTSAVVVQNLSKNADSSTRLIPLNTMEAATVMLAKQWSILPKGHPLRSPARRDDIADAYLWIRKAGKFSANQRGWHVKGTTGSANGKRPSFLHLAKDVLAEWGYDVEALLSADGKPPVTVIADVLSSSYGSVVIGDEEPGIVVYRTEMIGDPTFHEITYFDDAEPKAGRVTFRLTHHKAVQKGLA